MCFLHWFIFKQIRIHIRETYSWLSNLNSIRTHKRQKAPGIQHVFIPARMVVAESLARIIAVIRITSVHWRSCPPSKTQNSVPRDLAFVVPRFELRLAFICATFVPRGTAERPARVDRVRWTLAIGDWRFGPSKHEPSTLNVLNFWPQTDSCNCCGFLQIVLLQNRLFCCKIHVCTGWCS